MLRLTLQTGAEAGKVHEIASERVMIGRSVNNDLQIIDRRMSRNHSEIYLENGQWKVRDMGSKNGTLLNGAPCAVPTVLNVGDIIQVGDTEVLFHDESHDTSKPDKAASTTGTRKKEASHWKVVDENQWGATRGELRAGVPARTVISAAEARPGAGSRDMGRRLEILYQVTEAIRSTFALDELLEQIMQIIMEVIKPDRAYLLFRNQETGEILPEVIKTAQESVEREVKISTSIVERCMSEGVSLLVSDAAADDRFAASESIIINRIRTAMVAPLIYKGETMGVVYIDTNTRLVPFTQDDLELLTGITNQAALAISNARLHSQLVEQHKLAREMEIARTIQMNLLPKVYPHLEGYQISAMSLPAKHVGGDYYDFLHFPDGRIGFAVADVSGKGVPAAILTATTRSYLQSETQHPALSLPETVARINAMVHRDVTNEMYVTMALICIEASTGAIEYVNAGHSHPILMRADGDVTFLDRGGLFLGIVPDTRYESGTLAIAPGDVLVLDTDGVTDIQNRRSQPYGAERLHALLRKSIHLAAEEIRNAIYQDCLRHRGDADQFDDFTLIVIKRERLRDAIPDEFELD